jgi:crotonobetainyl-CoA:carnitine CoA-transferase CaiB-like acyl-CoA transferase
MTSSLLPLSGVRVLDLTWHAAGPFATRLLADYGAEVIKVERPGTGDPTRRMAPFYKDEPGLERSGLFMSLNTNKKSITLNLKSEQGREMALGLVEKVDVVVENFAPRVLRGLSLDYGALSARNPGVVMTSISNFGQSGPYRDWGGSDLTLYAMGGPMLNTGHADREPLKVAGRIPSYHVGATAASATTIALLAAEESGEGDHIDLSFFETWMGAIDRRTTNLLGYQYSGHISTRPAVGQMLGSGIWPCMDGFFFTTLVAPRFPAMARMIGAEHLVDNPNWSTPAARANPDRVDEFAALAIGWFIERTRSEIRDEVDKFGIYGGPINSIEDFVTNEHFLARQFFQEIDHPTTGPITYPGYSFRITSEVSEKTQPEGPRRRAPLLGEHTDEVLENLLDMDVDEVAKLRKEGAV